MLAASARWKALAATTVLGLVVGLVVALLHHPRDRAQASLVVAPALNQPNPTLTATAASLVKSTTVAVNVISALHLHESPGALLGDLGAHVRPGTAIVDITATRGSKVDAQRVAQEVVVVFEQIADARLGTVGSGPAVQVFDSPDDNVRSLGRPYASWIIGGGSLGLLLGVALLFAPRRKGVPQVEVVSDTVPVPDTPVAAPEPEPEIDVVPDTVDPPPEPEPEPEPPEPEPEPPEPEIEVLADAPQPPAGLLGRLKAQVDAEADPERHAELAVYYDQLAPFATPEGELPANLIGLVEEVFGRVT